MCVGDECFMMPLDPKLWWRCVQHAKDIISGIEVKHPHWRCAHCLKRFQGEASWQSRILILGVPGDPKVEISRCGKMSTEANNVMTLLKRSVILEKLGDQEVTEENLFKVIRTLSEDIADKFRVMPNHTTFVAQDPTILGFRNSGQEQRKVHCFQENLSLKYVGTQVSALSFKDCVPAMLEGDDMDKIMARAHAT